MVYFNPYIIIKTDFQYSGQSAQCTFVNNAMVVFMDPNDRMIASLYLKCIL